MVRYVLVVAALVAGCEKRSELYCMRNPDDIANCGITDAGIDARPRCTGEADCTGAAPYCEEASGYCVSCLVDEHCTDPAAMQCDAESFTCKGCQAHAECASNVCLPNGVCGDDTNTAFVSEAGTATTGCTASDPCGTVANAVATARPYIKLSGALVQPVVFDGVDITVLADPATTLRRGANGIAIDIKASSNVTIYDLTILGQEESAVFVSASSVALHRCVITDSNKANSAAIDAVSSSTLTVSRCTIRNNAGGGIRTDSTTTYVITNNFIYRNGAADTDIGGARLEATTTGVRRFEMNTVVDNVAQAGSGNAGGVACYASGLAIPNNLVVRNAVMGTSLEMADNELTLTAHCNSSASLLGADIAPYSFVMPDGAGPWDYHVGPGSMAIDRGETSTTTTDVDGDLRPQGPAFDVGADEYKQP